MNYHTASQDENVYLTPDRRLVVRNKSEMVGYQWEKLPHGASYAIQDRPDDGSPYTLHVDTNTYGSPFVDVAYEMQGLIDRNPDIFVNLVTKWKASMESDTPNVKAEKAWDPQGPTTGFTCDEVYTQICDDMEASCQDQEDYYSKDCLPAEEAMSYGQTGEQYANRTPTVADVMYDYIHATKDESERILSRYKQWRMMEIKFNALERMCERAVAEEDLDLMRELHDFIS